MPHRGGSGGRALQNDCCSARDASLRLRSYAHHNCPLASEISRNNSRDPILAGWVLECRNGPLPYECMAYRRPFQRTQLDPGAWRFRPVAEAGVSSRRHFPAPSRLDKVGETVGPDRRSTPVVTRRQQRDAAGVVSVGSIQAGAPPIQDCFRRFIEIAARSPAGPSLEGRGIATGARDFPGPCQLQSALYGEFQGSKADKAIENRAD